MPKIVDGIKVKGTIQDVCFYEMDGAHYLRMKPGPDRKAFLKNSRYAPQREASLRMNKGNKIASLIYNTIAKDKRVYQVNCELQKKAAGLLKGGLDVEEVTTKLCDWLVSEGLLTKKETIDLPTKAKQIDFSNCVPGSGMKRDIDHFKGVRIQTIYGRWIRIYHMDEWELMETFEEEMEKGDQWVEVFLAKRRKLASYRLKHKYKRRCRRKISDGRCNISDVRCENKVRVCKVPKVMRYSFERIGDEGLRKSNKVKDGRRRMKRNRGKLSNIKFIGPVRNRLVDGT